LWANCEIRDVKKQNINYVKISIPFNQCFGVKKDIALLRLDSLNDVIYGANYGLANIIDYMTNLVIKEVKLN
jgi:hypothetical protein